MADAFTTPGGIHLPADSLHLQFSRAGGPGGQHVNTSATRVELVCDLRRAQLDRVLTDRLVRTLGSVVRVVAADSRSQATNRASAYRRLGERLDAAAAPPKTRRATRPTRASRERRLDAKRRRSRRKQDRRWRPDD